MSEEEKDRQAGEASAQDDVKQRRRVFIVGLGQSGRDLVLRLQDSFNVTGLDTKAEKLELLREDAREDVKAVLKDGTSKITWQELDLRAEDTVIAMTRRDDINLEVCRVVSEYYNVTRRFAVANTIDRFEEFHQGGIEAVSRPHVISASIASRILQEHTPATNIGLGAGEIVEVQVMKNSFVVGKKLKDFRAHPWLVAAVYREGRLIVPHGNTAIKDGDRVVLVGDPHILPTVADFFRVGEAEFPLQFGSRIALVLWSREPGMPESLLDECYYLIDHSRSRGILVVTPPGESQAHKEFAQKACDQAKQRCVMLPFADTRQVSLSQLLDVRDAGCLVLRYPRLGFLRRLGLRSHFFMRLLQEGQAPVLIARGTYPYKRILLPVEIGSQTVRVAELAIDLARLLNAQLDAVTVTPPAFSVGRDTIEEQKQVLTQVERLCSLYSVPVKVHHLEGNPIREVVNLARDFQLVMIGYGKKRKRGFRRFDLSIEITHRVPCSVMMLPYGEAP